VDTDSLYDFVRAIRQGENVPSPDCSQLLEGYAKMNGKEAWHEASRAKAESVARSDATVHRSLGGNGIIVPAHSLWFHYRLIVIAQVVDRTLRAAWAFKHANTLPMP